MTNIKKSNLNEYKIGSKFIIKNKPTRWASRLQPNCPLLDDDLKYPYHGKIQDIIVDYNDNIAMSDGIYGWCLTTLIDENKITNLKEQRKRKLKKINKCQN